MTQETRDRTKTTDRRVIDGHRLSEFVYGTVTGMVAVAGIGGTDETTWWNAASIIIVGAVAIWLAHSYSIIFGKRVSGGQRLGFGDLIDILRGSWPIVIAGTVLALPMLPAAFGVWNVTLALLLSNVLGIAVLGLVGLLAGRVARETWPRTFLLAAVSAGLGLIVVGVELVVHH